MFKFRRTLRLRDLEIFMAFKNNISLGYLVIEDLRRPLMLKDIGTTFQYMEKEDIGVCNNIIKVDIISDEPLSQEDSVMIETFADGLVDLKDNCASYYNYKVDLKLFEEMPLTEDVPFYQTLLKSIGSNFDISKLDLTKLMYLSQD